MSIKTFVGNMRTIWNKEIATQDDIKRLEDMISGIKITICDINRIVQDKEIELNELLDLIDPMRDQLRLLNTNMDTIQAIVNAIDNKRNNTHKPNKPHYPVIDEEEEIKDTRGTEERYKEIMNLNFGTDKQRDYIFVIEMYLKDIPMFKGSTYQELKIYMDEYRPKFETWKRNNNISYAVSPFKNKVNISNKRGGYGYGM